MNIDDFIVENIALPRDIEEKVKKIGEIRGQTVNGFILSLVIDYLKKNKIIDQNVSFLDMIRLSEVAIAIHDGTVTFNSQQLSHNTVEETKKEVVQQTTEDKSMNKVTVNREVENPVRIRKQEEANASHEVAEKQTEKQMSASSISDIVGNIDDKISQLKSEVQNISLRTREDNEEENVEQVHDEEKEDIEKREDEEDNEEVVEEDYKFDFVKLAEKVESIRSLGNFNMKDIIDILNILSMPTASTPEVLQSMSKVSTIISRYHADPSALDVVVKAISKGEITVDDAYNLVLNSSSHANQKHVNERQQTRVQEEVSNDEEITEEELNIEHENPKEVVVEEDSTEQEESFKATEEIPPDIDNNNNTNENNGYNILRRAIENLNLPK